MHTKRLALAGLLTTLLISSVAVHAAEIVVTMKDDVVADDGRCSLREAIDAANTDSPSGRKPGECIAGQRVPVVDVVRLRRGTYRLKRGAAGDDLNVGGDLDITESVIIQGKGQKGTVIQNGIGNPEIAGDGDRLFHVDPGAAGGIDVTFSKLTLARGDVTCAGPQCDPGGSAVDHRGSGSLTFESCTVMRNVSTCTGTRCGDYRGGGAISAAGGGDVAIRGTTVKKNSAVCAAAECTAGAAAIAVIGPEEAEAVLAGETSSDVARFTLDDSEIVQNSSVCVGAGCSSLGIVQGAADDVAMRAVTVAHNTTICDGVGCAIESLLGGYADDVLVAEQVRVTSNQVRCTGIDCYAGSDVYLTGAAGSLRGAWLQENVAACDGDGCSVGYRAVVYGQRAIAEGVEARSNGAGCLGEQCQLDPLLTVYADADADVVDVELTDNTLGCEGDDCRSGALAWWYGAPLRTLRTEIASNGSTCTGERCALGALLLLEATGDTLVDGQEITGNAVTCTGPTCFVTDAVAVEVRAGDLTLVEPVIEANEIDCQGPSCTTLDVLNAYADALSASEMQLSDNRVRCAGVGCTSGGVAALQATTQLDLGGAFVGGNATSCAGDYCRGLAVLRLSGADGTVAGSTFTRNQARCDGEECATGTGGALRNQVARMTIRDSEITSNATDGFGGAIFNEGGNALTLDGVGVFQNEAGLRGVMEFGGLGGAIYNDASSSGKATLTLIDTQIRANRSLRQGGGVANEGTIVPPANSAIADNTLGNCFNFNGGTGCP